MNIHHKSFQTFHHPSRVAKKFRFPISTAVLYETKFTENFPIHSPTTALVAPGNFMHYYRHTLPNCTEPSTFQSMRRDGWMDGTPLGAGIGGRHQSVASAFSMAADDGAKP